MSRPVLDLETFPISTLAILVPRTVDDRADPEIINTETAGGWSDWNEQTSERVSGVYFRE